MAVQDEVARRYMARKGYGDLRPQDVERLEGTPCWYYYYDLPEGLLELEVFWHAFKREWLCSVTSFTLHDDGRMPMTASR